MRLDLYRPVHRLNRDTGSVRDAAGWRGALRLIRVHRWYWDTGSVRDSSGAQVLDGCKWVRETLRCQVRTGAEVSFQVEVGTLYGELSRRYGCDT